MTAVLALHALIAVLAFATGFVAACWLFVWGVWA